MREKTGGFTENLSGRTMTALAVQIERELREIVPRVMAGHSAKIIAFKAGSTPRTAENWQAGLNLPQGPHLIMLARQFPELRTKVLEWLDAEQGDSDPSRVLDEIAKLMRGRV